MAKEEMVLVCGSYSNFPDDLRGQCSCGKLIVYRPHAAHIKKKLCIRCAYRMAQETKEAVQVFISKKTRQEVSEFLNQQKN